MSIDTAATRHLDNRSIPYRVFIHRIAPTSIEEAARERQQEPGQVIRSILFRNHAGQFILVLVPGLRRVSWKKVRAWLKTSRLSLASQDEVWLVTGYDHGTVNPFGMQIDVRILVDESVFWNTDISLGSGVRGVALILSVSDLPHALGVFERGDFAIQ